MEELCALASNLVGGLLFDHQACVWSLFIFIKVNEKSAPGFITYTVDKKLGNIAGTEKFSWTWRSYIDS